MKSLALLLLPSLALAQCDGKLPSGKECLAEDYFSEADPKACSWYYKCDDTCVTHEQCQPKDDGLPQLFHEVYEWCAYSEDVDCGSRPCVDEDACVTKPPTTPAPSTTPDCGHLADCKDMGNGFHPDPYNCRKYWECIGPVGTHHTCPDDPNTGHPEMWDLAYDGCNYVEYTDCGDRPICDECDEHCEHGPTTPEECGHLKDCKGVPDGWYADEWNCRKYWQCSGGKGIHHTCPTNDDGTEQQYNPAKNWCDFDENVECGDRPVCDVCDENCHDDDGGGGADCGPDDHHPPTICKGRPDGWYADKFNCIKYWHCSAQLGEHFLCGEGLVYEATKVQCDYPERVDCGDRPICDHCDKNCHA